MVKIQVGTSWSSRMCRAWPEKASRQFRFELTWQTSSTFIRVLTLGLVGLLLGDSSLAVGQDADPDRRYDQEVLPLLKTYCADCHSQDSADERWTFDRYQSLEDRLADQEAWAKVAQLVEFHIMPPVDEAAPTVEQRRVILDWIDQRVFYVDPERPDPGQPVLRRLNRAEYNNSVRDVFGTLLKPADAFPADDAGYGFDNIGDVLTVSPLHFEKYLSAARDIAEEVTRLSPPPRLTAEYKAEALEVLSGQPIRQGKSLRFTSFEDRVGTSVEVPVTSTYGIVIQGTSPNDDSPSLVEVLCDGEVVAELKAQGMVFALVNLQAGSHDLVLRLAKNSARSEAHDWQAEISFFAVDGPLAPVPPQPSEYLSQFVGTGPLATPVLRLSGEELLAGEGRSTLDTGRVGFTTNGYRQVDFVLDESGEYRFRFKVGAQQVGDEPARFEVRLGEQRLGPFAVTAQSQAEQWIEAHCELPAGQHHLEVWFLNEFVDPQTNRERWFWLHELTIEGSLGRTYGLSREQVIEILLATGRRLYRRPLSSSEQSKLEQIVELALEFDETPLTALGTGLEAMLVSPHFLYHPAPRPMSDNGEPTGLIDELSLASRLASFLWSSTPDLELLRLAESGQLRAQLGEQVKRMIDDSKSRALTDNFAGQWLQLRNLDLGSPDPETFPEFDEPLAAAMRRETELLFEYILHNNRSVLEFLDADYTFLNRRLARHYGLPEPDDDGFQKVSLAGTTRRGVVTHGSILTITSLPTRTSPVKRGKWLLEQLLDIEPPPPPGNIPPLPESEHEGQLSLRELLEQHRADATCASCHALLDPPGLALENYDAIGRWRASDGINSIDASGQLITGQSFRDWEELQRLLATQEKDRFVESLTRQLLTYALGRGLTFRDKVTVEEILRDGAAADLAFQELILAICESSAFQTMRTEHWTD